MSEPLQIRGHTFDASDPERLTCPCGAELLRPAGQPETFSGPQACPAELERLATERDTARELARDAVAERDRLQAEAEEYRMRLAGALTTSEGNCLDVQDDPRSLEYLRTCPTIRSVVELYRRAEALKTEVALWQRRCAELDTKASEERARAAQAMTLCPGCKCPFPVGSAHACPGYRFDRAPAEGT